MPIVAHNSGAPGKIAATASLQSRLFATKPAGCVHDCVVDAALPNVSPSTSAKNVDLSVASLRSPSQSLSMPIVAHNSGAPGKIVAMASLQSRLFAA